MTADRCSWHRYAVRVQLGASPSTPEVRCSTESGQQDQAEQAEEVERPAAEATATEVDACLYQQLNQAKALTHIPPTHTCWNAHTWCYIPQSTNPVQHWSMWTYSAADGPFLQAVIRKTNCWWSGGWLRGGLPLRRELHGRLLRTAVSPARTPRAPCSMLHTPGGVCCVNWDSELLSRARTAMHLCPCPTVHTRQELVAVLTHAAE